MGVSRFDPLAGGITAQSYAKALSEIEMAQSRSPESRSSRKGKCQCCGAWEYVMTKAGEICSYCRVPIWANSRELSPHSGVTGDKGWYASMAAERQLAKDKVILRFALGADTGIIRPD